MKIHETMIQWMRAEKAGGERSEELLTTLLRSLPVRSPSPAMVDRVLLEFGLGAAPRRSPITLWTARLLLVAAVLLVAVAVPVAPALATWLLPSTGDLVSLATGLVGWGAASIALAVTLWSTLARIAEIVSLVLATPQGFAAIGLSLAIGWLSFRWLERLTSLERSASHADPI